MIINLIAEGYMEENIAARLLPFCGHEIGAVFGRKGCSYVRKKAAHFRHLATESTGVLVLTDFRDSSASCVPEALQDYLFNRLPNPPRTFLFRFAVNELESWLLADREGLSKFLRITLTKMPLQPESEEFPKVALVNLARASRERKIREGLAPSYGHMASVGSEYMSIMHEFIDKFWNIEAAMSCAPSLERCVRRLRELT